MGNKTITLIDGYKEKGEVMKNPSTVQRKSYGTAQKEMDTFASYILPYHKK